MRDIKLNQDTLDLLNEGLLFTKKENYEAAILGFPEKYNDRDREHFTSYGYFERLKAKGVGHHGFPEVLCAHSFSQNNVRFSNDVSQTHMGSLSMKVSNYFKKIQTTFNLKRNALFSVYPPNGYISWHNNANASAYNFIFTYSETGDGWWKHWDMRKKEMVTIPDVKGWQCKAGYFGSYTDPIENLVYHSAVNGPSGVRMTVAFILDRSEMSLGLQDWIIEDISE